MTDLNKRECTEIQESAKNLDDMILIHCLPQPPRHVKMMPALVVELKWNQSAEGAIQQIKDRQYTAWLEGYTGNILLVGINYDRKCKTHECIIENMSWNSQFRLSSAKPFE